MQMARNPKQLANLTHKLTANEQRKGGRKSGQSRGAMKTFKQALMDDLTPQEQKVMNDMLKRQAMRGNLPSYEFLLKMLGQHPDQGGGVDQTININIQGFDGYGE